MAASACGWVPADRPSLQITATGDGTTGASDADPTRCGGASYVVSRPAIRRRRDVLWGHGLCPPGQPMLTHTRPRRSAALRVVSLDDDLSHWTSFVRERHDSTYCHLAGWREIMSDVLGHDCPYAAAVDESGALQGVLPLVRVRAPLVGHHLVSMPFLNAGGPLGDTTATHLLTQHARRVATTSGVDLLELRTRNVVASSLRVMMRKLTVLLTLPAAGQTLWEGFPAKLRSQIRLPKKLGLDARFGPDQRDSFYDVFAAGMRTLGTPVLPVAFFERIARL